MAASTGSGDHDEAEKILHRRVQQRIAGHFLHAMDEDGEYERFDESTIRKRMSEKLDEDTRKKFEAQYGKYQPKRTVEQNVYTIQNVLWLMSSIAMFYYTDFYLVIRYDTRINRWWFNIGAVCIAVNVCIALFLIVWISCVKKIKSNEWEKRYPAAIPVATAAFVIGGICVTVGLWPVWHIFTPVILFVLFMGFVVTVAMLPNF